MADLPLFGEGETPNETKLTGQTPPRRLAARSNPAGDGSALNAGLGRRFLERAQNCIDASLIARSLRLQPFEHIRVDAKRNRSFRRNWFETATDYAPNDVFDRSLGMFRGQNNVAIGYGAYTRPIGLRGS